MADPMTAMAIASAVGAGASVHGGMQARSQAKRQTRKADELMQQEQQQAKAAEQRAQTEAEAARQRQRRQGGAGGRQGAFLTGGAGIATQQGQQRTLLGG